MMTTLTSTSSCGACSEISFRIELDGDCSDGGEVLVDTALQQSRRVDQSVVGDQNRLKPMTAELGPRPPTGQCFQKISAVRRAVRQTRANNISTTTTATTTIGTVVVCLSNSYSTSVQQYKAAVSVWYWYSSSPVAAGSTRVNENSPQRRPVQTMSGASVQLPRATQELAVAALSSTRVSINELRVSFLAHERQVSH